MCLLRTCVVVQLRLTRSFATPATKCIYAPEGAILYGDFIFPSINRFRYAELTESVHGILSLALERATWNRRID